MTVDFKWGDFYQDKKGYTDDRRGDGRSFFGVNITQSYLEKHNIKCIIGGHQDYQNLTIMVKGNDLESTIQIKNKEWVYPTGKYKLYIPKQLQDEESEIDVEFELNPGKDFIALITSTAVVPRAYYMCCNTYLEMKI